MSVQGLDHINLRTADIEATARFYIEALGLQATDVPGGISSRKAIWLKDSCGNPILHLQQTEDSHTPNDANTDPVHHIALRCDDKEVMLARLHRMNLRPAVYEREALGLTQVFLKDPHGVLLELSFHSPTQSR
ncbi:VOC family protein [Pseudomaricurvus sp. HS19]|uniref:VOC family protein n=1 Tax=Pseudomaricurvus sp. HS19 TaxID=2692626 RepID=UPI00136815F2|nr:VOC family protein [Pseudomaricurvus sp. HS19]MYM62620.1 hypothetical protein [Pseudomaricurvus sp. HS19]